MASRRLLVLCVLVACVTLAGAGATGGTHGSLSGTIRDGDGEPLAGATITLRSDRLLRGQTSVVSGKDGRFHFQLLPPGNYGFRATREGYKDWDGCVLSVGLGKAESFDAILCPTTIECCFEAQVREAQLSTTLTDSLVVTSGDAARRGD